jgi:hypothetical protein
VRSAGRDDAGVEAGGELEGLEVSPNYKVGDDDELSESSHGVGGLPARMIFQPRETGRTPVLVSSIENIHLESGSELVLELEEEYADQHDPQKTLTTPALAPDKKGGGH